MAAERLVRKPEFRRDRQLYSTTFEWFVAELLIRKFMAFSSSFGVSVEESFGIRTVAHQEIMMFCQY